MFSGEKNEQEKHRLSVESHVYKFPAVQFQPTIDQSKRTYQGFPLVRKILRPTIEMADATNFHW